MRTFSPEPKTAQRAASARPRTAGQAHLGDSHDLSVLHLQRTVGNQAVQRMLRTEEGASEDRSALHAPSRFKLQPKLRIGPTGDRYEQEAERVSQEVLRMPEPALQRTCSCGGECPDCKSKKKGQEEERLHLQRAPAPAPNTAAGGPKLDFRPAKNSPPCACLVFIHHNEPNARLMAQWMYELCRYNLAIVDPQTREREVDLPAKGKIDPNELFPRKVAEECWADDKPCEDFLSKNAGATKAGTVEEYAQRQFFLAIKKCSDGFSLPVVALHNNTIDETARYRKAVKDTKAPLDVKPIQGKTFDDSLKSGETSTEPNTLPFTDLQDWLLKNVPGVEKKKKPKGSKGKLEGGPIAPGKTNIFLWCSAEDISHCQIGDPERPDNVVWVTNTADFEKLRGTKTNVVLQSRVDPAGRSATDLSSLFVFLEDIVDAHFVSIISKLEADIAVEAAEISDALDILLKLKERGDQPENPGGQLREIMLRVIDLLLKLLRVQEVTGERAVKLSRLRFINIETPQSPYDSTTKPEDLRVQSYRDVRATLGALGLDCCDAKPAEGETESAVEKVEKALREGKAPKS